MSDKKKLTTASGRPYTENENTMSVVPRGPLLFQDYTKCGLMEITRSLILGVLALNENSDNYFQDVEQAAFAPAHMIDGIGYSPDKMLQGRLLSYPDAHCYRLRINYEQIRVDRCPFAVNNDERDGNQGRSPNYFPNSFDDISIDPSYKAPA